MARRPKSRRAGAELLRDYGPAVTSVVAVIISVAGCLQTQRVQSEADARERVRAEIYFEGTPPAQACSQARTPSELSECAMHLKPADPAMRPLRTIVQYPASEHPDGSRTYDEYYAGEISIPLIKRENFLSERILRIYRFKNDESPKYGIIPITIFSNYIYNGKKYFDYSAYHLVYTVSKSDNRRVVIPQKLLYCGRLRNEWPTFLVDTWLPTKIGFDNGESTGLLFECMGKATWFNIKRGRYEITSDVAARIINSPPPASTIPYDVKGFSSNPIGTPTPLMTRQLKFE